ncbi:putative NAC domain transcriptional regulator superfamily protein [Tripterygium wilfordii]|uniref:Putative NAC domain transcriptional regulator superfamily protein n=1 Tax=Tripterygium wilfordii TaxID=458696 RepID=A0A7J7DKK8_TRIWF|nr:SUPPRESSOR OF GAMMA RESPONSE 1-like isoform X2 [Tripterygium wilfordii]KAF5746900.1 putative NAC domain transcriptional regulator superfamily protein [Tripterygium wilfordii]
MARTWLIDDRTIAKKVKNTAPLSAHEIHACGATRECPNCRYPIDNSDVSYEWPGLPAGVKFNPSDMELLEHLAAKCGEGNIKPHKLIDEFIPTLEGDKGICYTHPEKLPGAKKDGSSVYFFHRTFNAYATGQRKRRRVQNECSSNKEHVRWHKTGKTKPVMENGVQKGWKKIMVLYKAAKISKPDKSNWVVHQYHLGPEEDERGGEYVVSKIFHQQPKQSDKNDDSPVNEVRDGLALQTSPRTPNPNPPNPPRPGLHDNVVDDNTPLSGVQEGGSMIGASHVAPPSIGLDDDMGYPTWLAGESQAVETDDLNYIEDSWLCKEILDSTSHLNNPGLNHVSYSGFCRDNKAETGTNNTSAGSFDLENIELDTPPDFQLSDLNFDSQDSTFDWLDRL